MGSTISTIPETDFQRRMTVISMENRRRIIEEHWGKFCEQVEADAHHGKLTSTYTLDKLDVSIAVTVVNDLADRMKRKMGSGCYVYCGDNDNRYYWAFVRWAMDKPKEES